MLAIVRLIEKVSQTKESFSSHRETAFSILFQMNWLPYKNVKMKQTLKRLRIFARFNLQPVTQTKLAVSYFLFQTTTAPPGALFRNGHFKSLSLK